MPNDADAAPLSYPVPHADGQRVSWAPPDGAREDLLFGTGSTRGERALVWTAGAGGAAAVLLHHLGGGPPAWTWWQAVVAGALAVDVAAGAVANATGAVKRTYFTPPSAPRRGLAAVVRHPVGFTALHVHPLLVALLLPGASWAWAVTTYLGVLLGVVAVHRAPLHLQRPTAMLAFAVLVAVTAGFGDPAGWAWFTPLLVAKLVLAHPVREEPYASRAGA